MFQQSARSVILEVLGYNIQFRERAGDGLETTGAVEPLQDQQLEIRK